MDHFWSLRYNDIQFCVQKKYSLEEKENAFLHKYNALLDFHNCSFMNSNVESRVVGKKSRHVKVGL
jgi:hypothetical protein